MSYDLKLFPLPSGLDPAAAYEQLMSREEAELLDGEKRANRLLPDSSRARMQRLADALTARWSDFVQFVPAPPLPWIELNDKDLQIQVAVYEQSVSIAMPHFRERTPEMMECLKCCLHVCQDDMGYVAYDPQLGRVVTAADTDDIAQNYGGTNEALSGISGKSLKKRWWRFW